MCRGRSRVLSTFLESCRCAGTRSSCRVALEACHKSRTDDVAVPAGSMLNWGADLKVWELLRGNPVAVSARTAVKLAVKLNGTTGNAVGKSVSELRVANTTVDDVFRALSAALDIVSKVGTVTTEAEQITEAAAKKPAKEAAELDVKILKRANGMSKQHKDSAVLRCLDANVSSTEEPAHERVATTLKVLLSTVREALRDAVNAIDFVNIVSTALSTIDVSFVCPSGFEPTSSCVVRLCGASCAAAAFGRALGTQHAQAPIKGHGCGHDAPVGMCSNCAGRQGPWLAAMKVSEAAPHPSSATSARI